MHIHTQHAPSLRNDSKLSDVPTAVRFETPMQIFTRQGIFVISGTDPRGNAPHVIPHFGSTCLLTHLIVSARCASQRDKWVQSKNRPTDIVVAVQLLL
jgi:hypothetical protein